MSVTTAHMIQAIKMPMKKRLTKAEVAKAPQQAISELSVKHLKPAHIKPDFTLCFLLRQRAAA